MRVCNLAMLATLALSAATLTATTALAQDAAKTTPAMGLPGGASAISETHGNWIVNCQVINSTPLCSFSHQQMDNKNQRVFAIELTPRNEGASGNAALPFGLALQNGVTISVDDKPLGEKWSFSTCLIGGCLVPFELDGPKLAQLNRGKTMKISGLALDGGREVSFSVPLDGFASARERTLALLAAR